MSMKIVPPIASPARLLLPRELVIELRRIIDMHTIDLHITLNFLAEHVYTSQLKDGQRLLDATDFKTWLRELAEEASK
jgi:hypothetical protein